MGYDCGPSLDPLTDATHYFKGERENWFLSFEKFVLGVATYFLFLFLNGENLSKNKNPNMTPVRKKTVYKN